MDFNKFWTADEVDVYSDASKNPDLGMGGVCGKSWMFKQWERHFIIEEDPSIEYLELYALLSTVINWIHRFRNKRIIIFCDNMSVVYMVNNTSLKCKNCMVLIRKLVLTSMIYNVRIYARYVSTRENTRADMLSRLKIMAFKQMFKDIDENPTDLPSELWPMSKIWEK